jgi:hypothetical protein
VIILGCTEIPLALPEPEYEGVPLVDPVEAVARAMISRADKSKLLPRGGSDGHEQVHFHRISRSVSSNLCTLATAQRVAKKWKQHTDRILDAKEEKDLNQLEESIDGAMAGKIPTRLVVPYLTCLVGAVAAATLAICASIW